MSNDKEDTPEWYDAAATKSDLYYAVYTLLGAMFALYGASWATKDMNISLTIMGISVLCLSLGMAAGSDGINRKVWTKVIDNE